jgi:DNA-directed RNA polymerase
MEFYFPMFSDFRGRLYPLMNLLSYQGEDLSRALLIFGDSEVINEKGEEALKVYFSNLAGHDKDS